MIQCPWCGEQVILIGGVCPDCKHEVLPEHLEGKPGPEEEPGLSEPTRVMDHFDLPVVLQNRFKCAKCGGRDSSVQEVSMTGAGLSKLLDVQHHHYLLVSCLHCGYVEMYNPDVLKGHTTGKFSTILDILFGR